MKWLGLTLFVLLLCTSCGGLPSKGIEDMLKAPLMNQMQAEVYEGLSATLDTSQIVYQYPQSGDNRSPFIFQDLNGDGQEEAIVFYSYKDKLSLITMQILSRREEGWWPDNHSSIKATKVDFVDFTPFTTQKGVNLAVGWVTDEGQAQHLITIYSLKEEGLKTELLQPYHNHLILAKEGSTPPQLLLTQSSEVGYELELYEAKSNVFRLQDSVYLFDETSWVEQLIVGVLPDGGRGVYIDEKLGVASVAYGTEVVRVDSGKLVKVVGARTAKTSGEASETSPDSEDLAWAYFQETFRKRKVFSTDQPFPTQSGTEVAGLVKVPKSSEYLSQDGHSLVGINLIEYLVLGDKGFQVAHVAALNQEAGYLLFFPDRWVGKVTIVKDTQWQEWRIYKETLTEDASTLLLRIRVYHAQDFMDEFTKEDILLGTKGLQSYYAYLPETPGEVLGVTREEVIRLFTFT